VIEPFRRRPLGRTGFAVTPVCIGTSTLGFPQLYRSGIGPEEAVATARAALDGPFNFIDTSNGYGESERYIGMALAETGLPEGMLLATKVDPAPGSTDFSGRRVRESVAESQERLGLDELQLVHLHDPERVPFDEAVGPGGALDALLALRGEGRIRHLGVAGFDTVLLSQYLDLGVFDVLLVHNQFTLISQAADGLIDAAAEKGVAVLNAAPFGGGMLAKGPEVVPTYCYGIDDQRIRDRARAMDAVCREAGVPLAAAALQFSLRDERIASTVVGISRPARVDEMARLAAWIIPDAVWDALEPLAREGWLPR
jgi:D-threo-aldose 1-dehydrogenase